MASKPQRLLLSPVLLLLIIHSITAASAASAAANHSHSHAHPPTLPPVAAPSPAVAGMDCSTPLLNLSSCLSYVEQGSNLTVPEKGCCPSLAGLVDSNPICLCQLLSTSDAFGIKIDDTKALMLPTICHVQTPPVSLCNDLGIPVASPIALSPASGGGGGGAGEPSGLAGLVAPTPQTAGTPSDGCILTAGAVTLTALLAAGQAVASLFF